jgi:hypothetical protein
MMSQAKFLGELGDIYLAGEVSVAAGTATVDVSAEARNGECSAAWPVF